jgi:opacity protein-like surface antigen
MSTRTLLLGAVASVVIAGSAEAAGWYFGADVGANWVQDNQFDFGTGVGPAISDFNNAAQYDTGWALTGSVGWASPSAWRFEAELGYRANDMDLFSSATAASLFRTGEMSQFTVMANVLHDIPVGTSLSLSLGAGVGAAFVNVDDGELDESDTTFAWQLIGGLNWAVGSNTDLTLTYRYLNAGGPEVSGPHLAHIDTEHFDSLDNHTLSVGVRFR